MSKQPKTLLIEIPAFISEKIELDENSVFDFEQYTYDSLMLYLDKKIKEFAPIKRKKRNKNEHIVIQNIKKHEIVIGDNEKAAIIQAKAMFFGQSDRILEKSSEGVVPLDEQDKIGSDKNFFMMYPYISGPNNTILQWVILIYVDPNKETKQIIKIVKMILKNVFNVSPKYIKPKQLTEHLKNITLIPEVTITLEDNSDIEPPEYFSEKSVEKSYAKKFVKYVLKNVSLKNLKSFYDDKSTLKDFRKRKINLIINRQQLKLEEILDENEDRIVETIEELFNFVTEIQENEKEKMYDIDLMKEKLLPVLKNYLAYVSPDKL